MQVKETTKDGLKRGYAVKLDAKTINEKTESQLKSMGEKVKIPGFRPGKIPLNVLKQRYGKSVMGEVIERAVNDATHNVLHDNNLRPATTPKVEITSYEEGGDLDFKMDLEVLPEIIEPDYSKITLEKLVSDIDEKEVDEAVSRLAERNKAFVRREKGAKAQKGDQLLMDFTGKVDGVAFEGGAAKKFHLELGSGSFIPGFEDQLIGAKEGSDVVVKVTFPASYHKEDLAGKDAEFDVHVHEVLKGEKAEVTDEFAQKFGFNDLAALRKAVTDQFTGDYEAASRSKMKKQLFDKLEKDTSFAIPQSMLDVEFNSIWDKLKQAQKEGDEALSGKSDDELRKEYTKIAERRVRLGILLSEIAQKNKIQINQDELSKAIMQQAKQFPGQERVIFEFYQKNPQHLQELRGPIMEEKSVDFILAKAKINERKVSHEELMSEESEEAETSTKKPSKKKTA